MAKLVTKYFNGENLQQMTKMTEDLCFCKNVTPWVGCPCPGSIYMYITIIFKDLLL